MDPGFGLEDLLEVMDDRDGWRERVREICVSSTTWWYMYIYIYIYIYIGILGPVKPELGVIPSGQEIIHEWIFRIFLVKSSMYQ